MTVWQRSIWLGLTALATLPAWANGFLYGGAYRCEGVGHCVGAISQVFPVNCDPNKADECIPLRDKINQRLIQEIAATYTSLHECDREGGCHLMLYYPFLTEQEANDNRQRDLDGLRDYKVKVQLHTFRGLE